MGEQSEVVGEIKVVQLSLEGPLDAVSLSIRRLPHHPVYSEEEQLGTATEGIPDERQSLHRNDASTVLRVRPDKPFPHTTP